MWRCVLVITALTTLTLFVYLPIRRHDFIHYDDQEYVYENPHVRSGLNASNVAWAFTSTRYANWHPITWLTHMLDCQFFDLRAGAHHLVNLGIHLGNSILLYVILVRATRAHWPSALVALLFAVHPLH